MFRLCMPLDVAGKTRVKDNNKNNDRKQAKSDESSTNIEWAGECEATTQIDIYTISIRTRMF